MAGKWKPGESGNPKGRPSKGKSWASMLDKIGEEVIQVQKKGMSRKEAICRVLYNNAASGDNTAIQALMDRMEGKAKQSIEADVRTDFVGIPVDDFVKTEDT